MVQELRRVILSEEELRCALESFRRVAPTFLPPGTIETCAPTSGDELHVVINFTSDSASSKSEVKLSCAALLKPIIRFCIESNIMLPRDGKKSIMLTNSQVTLCISLDLNIDLAEHIKPLYMSQLADAGDATKASRVPA